MKIHGNQILKIGLAMGLLVSQIAQGAKLSHGIFNLNTFSNVYFFTLAPDVMTIGPILPVKESANTAAERDYIRRVFRHIVRKADQVIHDDVKLGYVENSNTNFSYYTFLVLALTVPHHESGLVHWRKTDAKGCSPGANSLSLSPGGTRNILAKIYRNPVFPIIPNCSELPFGQELTQVLASGNHDDLGIMQINTRWHSTYAEPAIYLNIFNSIDYGIEYIFDGFKELSGRILKDPNALGCSLSLDPYKQKNTKPRANFNLIRATWAGRYNSGSQICRFLTDFSFDEAFLRSLKSVLLSESSLFHKYLPPGTMERAVLDEITANFKAIFSEREVVERNTYLKAMLKLPAETYLLWQAPGRTVQRKMAYVLKPGKYTVYSAPDEKKEFICGTIASQPYGFLPIELASPGSQLVNPVSQSSYVSQLLNAKANKLNKFIRVNIPNMALYAKLNLNSSSTSSSCRTGKYYIKASAVTEAPVKYVSGSVYRAEVSASGSVNLRSNAGTQFAIVGAVKAGEDIIVQGDLTQGKVVWYRVLTALGVSGWVSASSVQLKELLN